MKKILIPLLLASFLAIPAKQVAGQAQRCIPPSFTMATEFPVGDGPVSVVTGDFNTDGHLDLVIANSNANNLSLLTGNSTGSFHPATFIPTGNYPVAVAAGDFNGDGMPDLAVGHNFAISILLGNGSGGFSAATDAPLGSLVTSIATGDYNEDGNLDLAVTRQGYLSLFPGKGDGSLGTATHFLIGRPGIYVSAVTTGDFNKDGHLDLAVARQGVILFIRGFGSNGFGPFTSYALSSLPDATVPRSITTGDFNGDGHLDLAAAIINIDRLAVLLGDGSGSFGTAHFFPVGDSPVASTSADFNGDGKADLAVANLSSHNVSVLMGNVSGLFPPATHFPVADEATAVATGDFNGDGAPDLAVTNLNTDNVSVLFNTCTAAVPPVISCPAPIALNTDAGSCGALVDFAATASGVPTPAMIYSVGNIPITSPYNFPVGTTPVTATATNPAGVSSCTFTVTITDNQPPSMNCPGNVTTTNTAGQCYALVNITPPTATDNCPGVSAQGGRSDHRQLSDPYLVGETTIIWTATDAAGNTTTCPQTITVKDSEAPRFIVTTATPAVLTPPNHKMRDVTLNYSAIDNCSSLTYSLLSVSSNEPGNSLGDGNRSNDIAILDKHHLQLRAERSGRGDGRVYTATVQATDGTGNSSTATIKIEVAHNATSPATRNSAKSNAKTEEFAANETTKGLAVSVQPNPTSTSFGVLIESPDKTNPITLQVFDQQGRLKESIRIFQEFTTGVGNHYPPGLYYIRVFQEKEHKEIKVIKLPG